MPFSVSLMVEKHRLSLSSTYEVPKFGAASPANLSMALAVRRCIQVLAFQLARGVAALIFCIQ